MIADLRFFFHGSQRERFRSGELVTEWLGRYPQILTNMTKALFELTISASTTTSSGLLQFSSSSRRVTSH